MSSQQLLLLLMLVQSGFCLMLTQNDITVCSDGQLELFLKQQYLSSGDSGGGYQLIVKENLKLSSDVISKDTINYFSDKDQIRIEYQGILKP